MPNPLTRAQQLENAAFPRHLRCTGNAEAAAAALGPMLGRFRERRRKHPAFAAMWDAALTLANAALAPALADGAPPPVPGEPRVTWSKSGRRQLRRGRRGLIDHAGRQRFLAALSASANVVLSAAAAGYPTNALYICEKRMPGSNANGGWRCRGATTGWKWRSCRRGGRMRSRTITGSATSCPPSRR